MSKLESSNSPLSIKNIVAGILITVIGGIILAYLIQDARFSPLLINQTQTSAPSIPTVTITPLSLGFKSLNDFSSVFSMYYPAEFDQISVLETMPLFEYGYSLSGTSGIYFIGFSRLSNTSLSDDEWKARVSKVTSAWLYEKKMILLNTRNSKNDQHSFLFESKDTSLNNYTLWFMEESDGIQMTAVVRIHEDKWSLLRDNTIISLDSDLPRKI